MHRTEIIHNKNEYKIMFLGLYAAFTVYNIGVKTVGLKQLSEGDSFIVRG